MSSTVSSSLVIQYIIVGLILLATVIWIIVKIVKLKKHGATSCCGCSTAASCPTAALKKQADRNKKVSASCCRNQASHSCNDCSIRSRKDNT